MSKVRNINPVKLLLLCTVWTVILLYGFADAGTKSAPAGPEYKIRKIVIDPGHGGKDPGALGKTSKEKDITLSVALKLGNYIKEHFPDVEVMYTRTTDVFVPLNDRATIANKNKADLFVSIHCNSAKNHAAHGAETWVMGTHKTEANLEVAKRENSVILLEDNYQENYDYNPNDPLSHIFFSLYQNAHLGQSLLFADRIQAQFRDRVSRKDRGVHQAGFVVLYRATMPSVLVELGFLSNPDEEKFLTSENGQVLMSSALFRAFRAYKDEMERRHLELGPGGGIDEVKVIIVSDKVPEENPQPSATEQAVVPEGGPEFRIQVAVRSTLPHYGEPPYRGLSGFFHEPAGKVYKVFYGRYSTVDAASTQLTNIRKKGFPDAFVVAFREGKQVEMPEAVATSR